MTRKYKKKHDPNQIDFFNQLEAKGEVQVPSEPARAPINANKIKMAISEAIKHSPFERAEICRQISELAGREVTVAMLNAYTSQARTTHQVPSDLLAPMTIILGPSILKIIAEDSGCTLAERREMQLARIGQFYMIHQKAGEQIEAAINDLPLMRRVGA